MDWLYEIGRVPRYLLTLQTLVLLLAVSGLLLGVVARRSGARLGTKLLQILAVLLLLIAFVPFDDWLLAGLEARFPRPADAELVAQADQLAGVIVLGGAISVSASEVWQSPQSNGASERLFEAVRLAALIGDKPLLYSSGGQTRVDQRFSEAAWAQRLLTGLGFPQDRLLLEEKSLSTRDNALFSLALLSPENRARPWLLVTSAKHLPRAVGAFRKLGWNIIAYPVDFESRGSWMPFRQDLGLRLYRFDRALKEWIGLLYYRVLGWSDELYPAPKPAGLVRNRRQD